MSDVVPFLEAVAAANSKPLQAALPQIVTSTVISPWSPQPTPATTATPVVAVETPQIDLAALTAQAIEEGRALGLRETEAVREKLALLIGELEAARQGFAAPVSQLIADAAAAVVEGWVGATDQKALFAPVVTAWIASGSTGAKARCHPDDVDALRLAIGATAIEVTADPTMQRGDIAVADATRELAHAWEPRLRELREAIAGALAE